MRFFSHQLHHRPSKKEENVDFALFSESPYNQNPVPALDSAIKEFVVQGPLVNEDGYYEFVEEWLDDPWLRLVIRGINSLRFSQLHRGSIVKHYHDEWPNPDGSESEIHILFVPPQTFQAKQFLDEAVMYIANDRAYNAFVESSLQNPWIRVVLFGINHLNWRTV